LKKNQTPRFFTETTVAILEVILVALQFNLWSYC